MAVTPKIGLEKPLPTDYYDVEVFNENADKIDEAISDLDDDKVSKEEGKVLSDNNFSDEDKEKLDNVENEAQKNVQSNWSENDSNADAFIKNKPTIPTKTSQLTNDSGFLTSVIHVSTEPPTNTKLLWIDTTPTTGGLKYFNAGTNSWAPVPVDFT